MASLTRPETALEVAVAREFLAEQAALFHPTVPRNSSGQAAPAVTAPSLDPDGRARASLIHALFNHNDFVTVR